MIDIHTHIMTNMDDGASSKRQTVELLKEAERAGFTDIIFTPHYIEGYFDIDIDTKTFKLKVLRDLTKKDIFVKLHMGAEVFISIEIDKWIREKTISSLGESRYILIELPTNSQVAFLDSIIAKIFNEGKVPIIAHPERYQYVQEDISIVERLVKQGVLFQSNFGSIIDQYGKKAFSTLKELLKNNYIQFLATDVHKPETIYPQMNEILKRLKKLISEEKIYELTEKNPRMVLQDQDILHQEEIHYTQKEVV